MYIVGTVILSFMLSNMLQAIDAWYMFKYWLYRIWYNKMPRVADKSGALKCPGLFYLTWPV